MESDQDPTNLAGTYMRLGELHEAMGDRLKAGSSCRKVVYLWKDAEVRRRIVRLGGIEGQ